LALALVAAACGGDDSDDSEADAAPEVTDAAPEATEAPPEATEAPPETESRKIGFSVYDMQYSFFQTMEDGTRQAVESAGYDYELHDEKSDESQMVSGAQALIDGGVDALIISPFKPDALGPIVAAAKSAGVPVVVNDIGGGGTDYDVIVISDNANGGVAAADEMDKLLTERGAAKQVASITCQPDAVYAARRNEGFETRMVELGYDVVASLNANSNADEAYTVMQDVLSANPDVAGVFSCNDPMAVAAANAILDAGKSPVDDIAVIGFNADPEALEAIAQGNLAGTVAQFPSLMGELTVDLATRLIDGETLSFDNPADREIFAPIVLVTADNLETFADEASL
jgi:ribose transport system substrate-binding protein